VGLPTREQAALVTPTGPVCIAQDELEPLLEEHLPSFDSIRVERGVELAGLDQTGDGDNVLTLVGPVDRHRHVHARYVIGADGLRSRVREELGIATKGEEGLAERVAVLFRAPLWELVGDHRYGIYFLTGEPEGRSLIPAGKPDRWILGMPQEAASPASETLTPERPRRWIRDAAGVDRLPIEVERLMPVSFGVALAERFRQGHAFLVGDAAHRVTPRGGTGLNVAIRDGFDIAWKLAWVLRDWAGDQLLDSYERERRPVAEFNTERSSRPDGSILATTAGLNADIGGRIAHAWTSRREGLVSTLDLLGNGLTLFVGPEWNGAVSNGHGPSPTVSVERLDAIAARALGLTTGGSLLARPDGHPIALRSECDLQAFLSVTEPAAVQLATGSS
jgi:2-polyprenyl-6-methoxyphenol hydroxylase-like FAD-dependent oxidoreductase